MQKCKGPGKAQTTCENDSKIEGIILPDFRTYQDTVVKIVCYRQKDKLTNGSKSRAQK